MILSFHPIFQGDRQIIVAGRDPDKNAADAMRSADAVILPQGCRESLYQAAMQNCPRVFPNYDARFAFPGKLKQIRLFQKTGTPHPRTKLFQDADAFRMRPEFGGRQDPAFPLVFKFDWGGEGETVYRVDTMHRLDELVELARQFEHSGQKGFMLQDFISGGNKTLRVAVMYKRIASYWRVQREGFYGNTAKGAVIDSAVDPKLQEAAFKEVEIFCRKTQINLAGFDLVFQENTEAPNPLFLEINYFFGRKGLGGSQVYYRLLTEQINRWISDMGLSYSPVKKSNRRKNI